MTSVEQYPSTFYALVANGSSTEIGSVSSTGGDLSTAHLRVYHKKSGTFSYNMYLKVSTSEGGPALATSDLLVFSNETIGQTTDDHLVDLTFTFSNKYTLTSGESYFFRVETTGYTRPARPLENTAYLSFTSNWFEPIGGTNSGGSRIVLGVEK